MTVEVYQRNDLLLKHQIVDDTGAPVQLAGASVIFTAQRFGNEVLRKSTPDGITIVDAAQGRIEIHLTHDDTNLPSGDYRMELLVIDADGNRHTAAQGSLRVLTSLYGE